MLRSTLRLIPVVALLAATIAPGLHATAPTAAFFVEQTWKTSNASVAVDAAGGTHMAYYFYEPALPQRPTHAVYAYCATLCDDPAQWARVGFGQLVREVELELTPTGQPRLLITSDSTVYTGGVDYHYASCDAACTAPSSWTVTTIASGKTQAIALANDDELPQHAFELDRQGRPRYVYFDENYLVSPGHAGLFYLTCDSGCDAPGHWRETLVTVATRYAVERVYHPALALTADGRPRIVTAEFYPIGSGSSTLAYLACDAACDNGASWQRADLIPRGSGAEPSADIEIDPQGNPRIAFYQEALLNGAGKRLFYLACDGGCLQPGNWTTADLGLGAFNGQEPDLELDDLGRPRIAYADWGMGGAGVASCEGNCASPSSWRHALLEDRSVLYRSWPTAYPPHCDGGLWNALTPSLAISPNGTTLVAYDATYHAHCLYDDDPTDNIPPVSKMHLIKRAVRVVPVASSPSAPGAPAALQASVSGNTVRMAWTPPASGTPPTGYVIVARTAAGGPVVASVPVGMATSFSAAVPNGTYVLSVHGTNAQGPGPESAAVTVTVGQTPVAPAPPVLSVTVSGATVAFSWTNPSGGGQPDGYVFEAGLTPGFATPLASLPLRGVTTASFAGVPPGTYFARVSAENAGGRSPASNEVRLTVGATAPPAPPTLHVPVVLGDTVTLTWAAGNGGTPSSYTLFASAAPGGAPLATVPLTGTSVSFAGVPSGTYFLRLTAANSAGTSAPSGDRQIVVP